MTTYTVTCTRSGDWWAIRVDELAGVFSQARRLDQVEAMAREAIALMLDIAPDSFDVVVHPEVPGEVARARQARTELRQAERSAEEATRLAARALLSEGYTVRDAGELLGISPQRVSQITRDAREGRRRPAA
ncbi:helix-turn-helix domain-containing protein [Micromonospora sp. NPDC000089]|uniref:helix-turn-helix domain-containing protein n=1 Tax=unclassified Micromonospora TaxID=2617518 RepID=UPI0036A040A5